MFEKFTERARQVVVLAQDESRGLKHNYIGTEHLLLGLLREEEGLAALVLESLGVTIEEVRAQVGRIVGAGVEVATGQIPFTPRAKKVLELSLREALSLGHGYIGTEHILLGLAREGEGVAARILLDFGVSAEQLRGEIVRMLGGAHPPLDPARQRELEQLQREKQEAIDAGEFERAAELRRRERALMFGGLAPPPPPMPASFTQMHLGQPRPWRPSPWTSVAAPLWASFGLAVGILLGWAIWGH